MDGIFSVWLDPLPIYVVLRTQDGATSVSPTREIRVPNGTLINNGDGSVSLIFSTLPDQTGQAGKFLKTDGANAAWATVPSPDLSPYALLASPTFTGTVTAGMVDLHPLGIGSTPVLTVQGGPTDYYVTGVRIRSNGYSNYTDFQQGFNGLSIQPIGGSNQVSLSGGNGAFQYLTMDGQNSPGTGRLFVDGVTAGLTVPVVVVKGGATPGAAGYLQSWRQSNDVDLAYIGPTGNVFTRSGILTGSWGSTNGAVGIVGTSATLHVGGLAGQSGDFTGYYFRVLSTGVDATVPVTLFGAAGQISIQNTGGGQGGTMGRDTTSGGLYMGATIGDLFLQAGGSAGDVVIQAAASGKVVKSLTAVRFPALADSAAPNDTDYYSTTSNKRVYKDSGGIVHDYY